MWLGPGDFALKDVIGTTGENCKGPLGTGTEKCFIKIFCKF